MWPSPLERGHVKGSETMVPLAHPVWDTELRAQRGSGYTPLSEAGTGMSAITGPMLPAHEIRLILTHECSLQIPEDSFYPFFPVRPGDPHFLNSGLARYLSLWLVCPTRLWGHKAAPIPRPGLLKPMAALPPWLLYHHVARGYLNLL